MSKSTMKAVVFKGKLNVRIEDRPIPKIIDDTDIIVKGHETTGEVVELGSSVKNHKKGDVVVMPFTVSCGECFYCQRGFSSRCEKSLLFGCPLLDGGQAEFMRVPLADATAVKAPEGIEEKKLVLMADIFPTGYFAAANAFREFDEDTIKQSVVVLIGCGPVGLCALINALEYGPKAVIAVDRVDSRLELAKKLGAEPFNDQTNKEGLEARVKELTDGRGADTIIEGVGHADALKTGFDLLRPWGNISSFGVHNEAIPWSGNQAYGKNLRIQMGRCPVRSTHLCDCIKALLTKAGIFPEALEMLKKKQHLLDFMTEKIMPMSQAVEGYEIFNSMKVQKVIFEAEHN
ncbi:GroES-like protein [Glarea lozoyensis ATCC 20868]|uniref:GroES-like protein n=1 Tax=Glarea lozoyensis (strain ATCC 20868 / MF5171) TaxID=1116229 RepID=S3EBK6_GLAL2|nr:GroES-like protein [Glarea lozoyensis ATCC 20868]EPE35688.1 GroES-like protein [Glarea lozoyensis ATCC 20868]